MSEAEVFFPQPRVVQAGGREVSFLPVKFGKIAAFFQAAQAPAPWLFMGEYLMALSTQPAEVRQLIIAAATEALEPEFVDGLTVEEIVALLSAVAEVNQGFFERLIAAGISVPMRLQAIAGLQTPSPDLAPSDTATETPSN